MKESFRYTIRGKVQAMSVLLFYLFVFSPLSAQTVKPITVSQDTSYTDHIALANDATDKDLMVKFQFNEQENTLTVSLISYRRLFVFWEDTRYKGTITSCKKRIRTDRLPYIVTTDPADRFKLGKTYRTMIPQPRKKYIFKKWIEYDGLQPQESEKFMLNDYIEQVYDIQNKRTNVTIRLHDILLMDQQKRRDGSNRCEITYGKDLNTEYQITIRRNPCFGLDEEIAAANNALSAIRQSYASLKETAGKGTVKTTEALNAFNELKQTVVAQFPKNENTSACPDIQAARDQYNLTADSIQAISVAMETQPVSPIEAVMGSKKGRAVNAKAILYNARQIDNAVATWLYSKDETQRRDMERLCRNLIKDTKVFINSGKATTPEEKNAINIFLKAENYFNKTCK